MKMAWMPQSKPISKAKLVIYLTGLKMLNQQSEKRIDVQKDCIEKQKIFWKAVDVYYLDSLYIRKPLYKFTQNT